MKKQSEVRFTLLLLLAVCAIPFALAQSRRSVQKDLKPSIA
jgi:hypothetical protein